MWFCITFALALVENGIVETKALTAATDSSVKCSLISTS